MASDSRQITAADAGAAVELGWTIPAIRWYWRQTRLTGDANASAEAETLIGHACRLAGRVAASPECAQAITQYFSNVCDRFRSCGHFVENVEAQLARNTEVFNRFAVGDESWEGLLRADSLHDVLPFDFEGTVRCARRSVRSTLQGYLTLGQALGNERFPPDGQPAVFEELPDVADRRGEPGIWQANFPLQARSNDCDERPSFENAEPAADNREGTATHQAAEARSPDSRPSLIRQPVSHYFALAPADPPEHASDPLRTAQADAVAHQLGLQTVLDEIRQQLRERESQHAPADFVLPGINSGPATSLTMPADDSAAAQPRREDAPAAVTPDRASDAASAVVESTTALSRDRAEPLDDIRSSRPASATEGAPRAENVAAAQGGADPAGEPRPESPIGYLGGAELANALGVHDTRRGAFFQQLMRQRPILGDDWREVSDPRPNSPRYLYRVNSPALLRLAMEYRSRT